MLIFDQQASLIIIILSLNVWLLNVIKVAAHNL